MANANYYGNLDDDEDQPDEEEEQEAFFDAAPAPRFSVVPSLRTAHYLDYSTNAG